MSRRDENLSIETLQLRAREFSMHAIEAHESAKPHRSDMYTDRWVRTVEAAHKAAPATAVQMIAEASAMLRRERLTETINHRFSAAVTSVAAGLSTLTP